MKSIKIFIFWWMASCFFFFYSVSIFAGQKTETDRLKKDLLELEKVTNPLIQTFRKVAQLVSPSVVSLSTEKKDHSKNGKETETLPPYQNFSPKHDPHVENLPKKGWVRELLSMNVVTF